MLLERYGILTVDHLSSVITHETTHALFRDYFEGIEVSPEEHKTLAKACFDLRKATYREIGKHFQENPELLGNLRAVLKPEHIRLARVLEEGAALGNLSNVLADRTDTENTTQNQCIMSGSVGQFFGHVTSAANLTEADFDGDLKYLKSSSAFNDLMISIDDFVREGSLYATAINESGYVMTEDFEGRKRAGHGEHSGHEVYASLMDAALNYPEALQVKLANLGQSERQAVKNMLDTEWDAAAARYPSLTPLFDRSRDILHIR